MRATAKAVPHTAEERSFAEFAGRHRAVYLPTGYAADLPLERVPEREPLIVREMGSAFVDLLAPLTSGRGGRFIPDRQGEQVYLPSGGEPLFYVGSRRGVPHHAMTGYTLGGAPPPVPRFLTARTLPEGPCDFRRDLWPVVARELAYAYYHELFTAHPSRTRLPWAEFEAAFAVQEWGGTAVRALIRKAVPRYADRLNLDRLDRPLHGIRFGDLAGLQRWMHGYLAADLERRADPAHSADLAMIHGLLAVQSVLAPEAGFRDFFDLVAGGPPAPRIAELRALARAGVVTFLGANLQVQPDERTGRWRASGPTVPGVVEARTLVEARWPTPSGRRGAGLFEHAGGVPVSVHAEAAGARIRAAA
ncbi:hypothetical protein GCM10022226_05880 [Sphaerisporangium flaviroseum]|uniref:Uncharacterized protein n=1 Tax=Sphaerisporangium flaviroseum TaxID=509199 RepID=A0ABP7HIK1_9ACTN